jgi:hypothetical protein
MSSALPIVHHQESNKTYVLSAEAGILFGFDYEGESLSTIPYLLREWRKTRKIKFLGASFVEKEFSFTSEDRSTPSQYYSSKRGGNSEVDSPLEAADLVLSSLCSLSYIHQSCLCTSNFRSLTEISSLPSSSFPRGNVSLKESFAIEVDIRSFRKLFLILVHARVTFSTLIRASEKPDLAKCKNILSIILWTLLLLKINLHRFIESQVSGKEIGISFEDLKKCSEIMRSRKGSIGLEADEVGVIWIEEVEEFWNIERNPDGAYPCFSEV